MMEMPELKDCPFCGGPADIKFKNEEVWVECDKCHAHGPWHVKSCVDCGSTIEAVCQAVNEWNKRDEGKKAEQKAKLDKKAQDIVDSMFKYAECC